jgi:hypothetical protein
MPDNVQPSTEDRLQEDRRQIAAVVATLTKLAGAIRIPVNRRSLWVNCVQEVVWKEWEFRRTSGAPRQRGPGFNYERLRQRADRFLSDLAPAERLAEAKLGEGFADLRIAIAATLATVEFLRPIADKEKPKRGGQPADRRLGGNFERFAGDIYAASMEGAGIKLTTNKNRDVDKSTLRAVLDTNFWLATHVVVVTLGYASTFVAGLLAITYIVLGVFTPLLKQHPGAQGVAASGGGRIEVGKAGFTTAVRTGIVLQVASNSTVDFKLQVGAVTETIAGKRLPSLRM